MPEVRQNAIDVVGFKGCGRSVQFAAHLDLRHDRALGPQSCHIAGFALAGGKIGGFRKVVEDCLRLFPFSHAGLALAHPVVFDVRIQRRLGRLAGVVLQVLVVEDETLLEPSVIVVQVVDFPLRIIAVPYLGVRA